MAENIIRRGLKIGNLDAEGDTELLSTCFVDNGQYASLVDVSSPASIVVGRTGAGKSAMLQHISQQTEHSIILDPHSISVQFIENSNIIQFFNDLGVRLDSFYRMLWRHILIVELLKLRYELKSKSASNGVVTRLMEAASRDDTKKRAIAYFNEWGDKFWLETSEQLQQITEKLTKELRSELGAKYSGIEVSLSGARVLEGETKREIVTLATQVISKIQVQRLTEVFKLLAEHAFQDEQKRYYVLIDQLDEDWAGTDTRCRLIRALIEETKAFRNIPNVKVITALRVDLLDLVFDRTRDSGFQQEKYESYLSPIRWTVDDLERLVNLRVSEVFKSQYTSKTVQFEDMFPKARKNQDALEYIINRTLMRPRDVIQFINECFDASIDSPRVSWKSISTAESNFSMKRLNSLKEEWAEIYPSFEITVEILRSIYSPFSRSSIKPERLEQIALEFLEFNTGSVTDPVQEYAISLLNSEKGHNWSDFGSLILGCLYHVGVIGSKISSNDPFRWSYKDQPRMTRGEVKRSNQFAVHKMLFHTLEINEREVLSLKARFKV